MQLWEQGKLDLDDRVTKFIPEFGVNGKEDVRLRHLLTHTAHLGGYLDPLDLPGFSITVKRIIEAPREPYRSLGEATLPPLGSGSGYNPAGIWIIAEICQRIDGRDFNHIIRQALFEPCGMMESWCGMPLEQYRKYKSAGRYASPYLDSEADAVKCQPAGGGVGPTRELGRFYEMMLRRGEIGGNRIVSPQTVEAMITPKSPLGSMGL